MQDAQQTLLDSHWTWRQSNGKQAAERIERRNYSMPTRKVQASDADAQWSWCSKSESGGDWERRRLGAEETAGDYVRRARL